MRIYHQKRNDCLETILKILNRLPYSSYSKQKFSECPLSRAYGSLGKIYFTEAEGPCNDSRLTAAIDIHFTVYNC